MYAKRRPSLKGDDLETVRNCGGYYICPKNEHGKRLGPLVGYAGKDAQGRQLVGDEYLDFSKVEQWPSIVDFLAAKLYKQLEHNRWVSLDKIDAYCGAPEGGKLLASSLARITSRRYIYPEKKTVALGEGGARDTTELLFSRHLPEQGEKIVLVEDVCNNFSTTAELLELIRRHGGTPIAIFCFLNRSPHVDKEYYWKNRVSGGGINIPVYPLVRKKMAEWEQDDPEVVNDIVAQNVCFKPKQEWTRLAEAMKTHGG